MDNEGNTFEELLKQEGLLVALGTFALSYAPAMALLSIVYMMMRNVKDPLVSALSNVIVYVRNPEAKIDSDKYGVYSTVGNTKGSTQLALEMVGAMMRASGEMPQFVFASIIDGIQKSINEGEPSLFPILIADSDRSTNIYAPMTRVSGEMVREIIAKLNHRMTMDAIPQPLREAFTPAKAN